MMASEAKLQTLRDALATPQGRALKVSSFGVIEQTSEVLITAKSPEEVLDFLRSSEKTIPLLEGLRVEEGRWVTTAQGKPPETALRLPSSPPIQIAPGWLISSSVNRSGGTIGAILRPTTASSATRYLLTAQHVLSYTPVGRSRPEVVVASDIATKASFSYVGGHWAYSSDILGSGPKADWALVEMDSPGTEALAGLICTSLPLKLPTTPLSLNETVHICGLTTKGSSAKVLNLKQDIPVDVNTNGSSYHIVFKDHVMISDVSRAFATGGDSGSIVYRTTANGQEAVGLLYWTDPQNGQMRC